VNPKEPDTGGGSEGAEMEINDRVKKLREKVANATPEICLERAWLMTQSYQETEGQPEVIRRAKALNKILSEMSIGIDEGELIVGKATSKTRGGPLLPEIQWSWCLNEMDTISTRDWDRFAPLSGEDKAKMRQFLPYWEGKALYDRWRALSPQDALSLAGVICSAPGYCTHNVNFAHVGINGSILAKGLTGLEKEADQELAKLNPSQPGDRDKILFLEAVKISLKAVANFANRYSELARSLAEKETDPRHKAELERIAATCRRVPANPARNFYEALQSLWFIYLALMNEAWGYGIGFGRPDQYLFPFYQDDLKNGRLTKEEALELIELLYIKLNALLCPQDNEAVKIFCGFAIFANIALGGITPDGRDAVNELTYLFLDAEEAVRLMSEDLIIRIHKNNPDSYVERAVEVLKTMKGKFKFANDEITIKQLMRDGKPEEQARDYVLAGCITPTIPSFSHDLPGSMFNLPLMLELALNNGVWRLTGQQIGPKTGDPRKFRSYDEVFNAYKKQLEFALPQEVTLKKIDRKLYAEYCPTPLQSALYPRCLKSGVDITQGGAVPYATQAIMATGAPNVADALAAIKKAVFEDKKISMDELIEALNKNFEGEDRVRHTVEACPKFGNDDDFVDTILDEVLDHFCHQVTKYGNAFGISSAAGILALTSNIPLGYIVGALPDGRKAGTPLADGGISPCQGRNVSGPTATMRSVAKLDHTRFSGGCVLNMRFNPDALQSESKRQKFASLIRTFFETGGSFVQFNIVSTETLRDAQRNPAKYKDLLVRVSTYSAYFVELSKELQEDIIARLEIQSV
jgi:pyruvate formate-lyase/glycerol dehydratase family glycyl radical enzyme